MYNIRKEGRLHKCYININVELEELRRGPAANKNKEIDCNLIRRGI